MKIAILGWGSLLWDYRVEFEDQHDDWQFDGPQLRLEFSRISESRSDALTLVLDSVNGKPCRIAYALSRRKHPDDAICDLRCREGTTINNIGYFFADNSRQHGRDSQALRNISEWAVTKKIDVVTWTDLQSNFAQKSKSRQTFTVQNAILHIQSLGVEGRSKAAEYVWRAPPFIDTPLRTALMSQPWFPQHG